MGASDDLSKRIAKRCKAVSDLLDEKERHVLTYVFHGVPKPYYVRWKNEANDIFILMVNVKNRRKRVAARLKKEAAAGAAAASSVAASEATTPDSPATVPETDGKTEDPAA